MTISLNEYQNEAMRTAIYPEDRGLEYTTLGLLSEVAELIDAYKRWETVLEEGHPTDNQKKEVLSELGDNYWYVAAIAHSMGERLEDVTIWAVPDPHISYLAIDELFLLLASYSGDIAGFVKKSIRDNEGALSPKQFDGIADSLTNVIAVLDEIALYFDATPAGVQAANLDKLADRQRRNVLGGNGDDR
ncbi:MazG-like pyrophosphatase [Arthrobacter phage Amigo]|uniref:MazG-like nucleotide pyrophosphohydrolase n=5 Tax=Amigovirus amigo TaxID=1982100 RepID=A0A5J6TDA0_9CAUD|nr:MazG-like pyrophosphatase [Arthrobacter phage Amigo]QFG08368.1 MazG-like nucleotide pyrophosphohydrolase [Arthrobacter phage Yeezus]QFG13417.1 MazG-like nucleotide pyrophosphohydrolase [Arthrobacter phage Ichor]QFG13935.1 MazG-like nucleotide pyrophosphohydrolase [Arthrobacter phage Jaek]QJD51722.1 MazG-like nucleotide pyrophosphohydrolase [Arthrobacter phage Boersma]ALY08422.1 MazG-like nucleotide pyrophosphohydrolase [Arthrobacter phage Amigo]